MEASDAIYLVSWIFPDFVSQLSTVARVRGLVFSTCLLFDVCRITDGCLFEIDFA